ncbi:MAG: hypothetical protein JWO92_1111 [Chitinophagaceae bacterium]|nr:hypothetical protein [Chitinophagaceae bacterium]
MRKLLTLFFFSLLLSCATEAQVKITDMPTYVGNPNGGWVPIVLNNVNRKIDAKYLGYAKIDSLFTHGDTLYWRNGSGIHYFKMSVNAYDTSYLYSILNAKLTTSDTTNKWISNLRRRGVTDTIEFLKNGTWQFAYKETSGSGFDSTFIYLALADLIGTIRDSLVSIRNKIVSDSSALRAAIELKLNISDTANKWVYSVTKNAAGDSFYIHKNGTHTALKDSIGIAVETDPTVDAIIKAIPVTADATTNKYYYWNNGSIGRHQIPYSDISGTPSLNFEPIITPPNTANKYWNGYKNFVTLNSDSLTEGSTNLFYTTARAALKLNISDTASMLANYQTAINARLKISDTASMLSPYFREVGFSLSKSGHIVSFDSTTGFHTQPYNDLRYLQSYTETDAIALAKTITATQGSGILITGSATQALSANPSWIFKADTSVVQTKFKSDTSRTNIYNAIAAITPGEANTASNLSGLGVGIWKDKSGVDLRFKRLKNEYGVTITDRTDSIGIAVDSSCSTCPASKSYVSNAVVGLITQSQLDDSTAAVRADFPTGSGFDSSIYSADGTVRANRIVTGNQKQLLFNNLSLGKFESKSASGKAVSSVQTGGYYVNNNVAYDSTGGNHWGTHINANNYTSQLESYQTTDGYTTTDDHSITVSPNGIIIQGEVQSGGPNYMYLNLGNLPHKTTLLSTDSLIFKENNNIGGRGLGLVHTVAVSDLGFSSTFYDSTLMATQQNLKDTAAALRADFPVGGSQGLQDVITTNPTLSQYNDIETGGYGLKINNTNGTTLAASIFLDSSDVYITTSNNVGVYSQVYSDVYGANLQAGTNTTYRAINVDSAHSRVDYNGTLKNIITSINGGLADSTGNATLSIPSAYTDEMAQDAIGAMVSGEFTYTDATPLLAINSIAASKITGTKTSAFISDFTTASQTVGDARYFQISNNLSEGTAATMRTNLGVARNAAFLVSVATDANITATAGTSYSLPAATLSTNRTIDVSGLNTNGDYIEIDNQEAGFTWSFTGATVYDGYENSVTTLLSNTRYLLRRTNGKIKIIN